MKASWREGLGRLIRFVLSGIANTGLSWLIYLALKNWMHYQLAFAVAYASGILVSYCLNALWVFKVGLSWRGVVSYPWIYLVQYALSAPLLSILIEGFHQSRVWAPLEVTALMVPLNYFLGKGVLMFGKHKDRG
jgi:putative flippase GtrA